MRQTANYSKEIVEKRRKKEIKRQYKHKQLAKIPKVKGMATSSGYWGMNRFTGLKPKKIEGFMLYIRGIKLTKKIWEKIYTVPYGTRMRMV